MDKLTFKEKLGYGSASVGDAVSYMFVTTFVMFFLTTVAGLQPAVAGTLTAIAAVWDALVNPIIGYLSDNARTRWGRRRPFMIGFCVPLFIFTTLLFTTVNVSYGMKVVYYGFMVIAFWTSFTGFFVPYYALGPSYTKSYEERATIRSYASFFNMVGTLFSMAMPTTIVQKLHESGMTEARAWQITAVFLETITVISIAITVIASKNKDVCEDIEEEDPQPQEKLNLIKMFREYIEVLKLGPMRWLLLTSLFYLTGYAMIMADFVYMLTYRMGFDGNGISMAMVVRCLIIICAIPIINKLSNSTDKRTVQLAILIFGIIGIVALRFVEINSTARLIVFIFITGILTQTYWQIMPAIFYDVCEYDEFETGKRREGTILSVQGFVEAIAAGFGAQFLGIILQFAGFDGSAEVQSQTAMEWVYNCTTWVPAILLLVAVFTLWKYPLTKEKYNEILAILAERKKNK